MQKPYNLYYKDVGNRRLQNLLNPITSPFPGFSRNSIFHYFTEDDNVEIDVSNPFFKGYDLRIQTDYASSYTANEGNPRRNTKLLAMGVRPFHIKNKQFQYKVDAVKTTGNQLQLVVYSYNQLKEFYLYPKSPMVGYYKWWNLHKTVFDSIEAMKQDTTRVHNVIVDVPKVLPARSILETFKNKVNPSMTRVFDTSGKLMMLEFWKFIDPAYRDKSIFGGMSVDTYQQVNLIFKLPEGTYSVLNLGYLNSWIKGQPNQTEFNAVSTQKYDIIQKLFLAFQMRLVSPVVEDIPTEEVSQVDPKAQMDPDSEADEGIEDTSDETKVDVIEIKTPTEFFKADTPKVDDKLELDDNRALEKLTIDFDKSISDVDKDLSALEIVTKNVLKQKGLKIEGTEITDAEVEEADDISVEELQAQVFKDPGVEATLISHLDEAAELGKISASDYRKMVAQVQARKQGKDPYGSNKTLAEASELKQEDLKLDEEKIKIVASPIVPDESMLESTLQSLNYDYITKTMKKDILNMVDGLQRSGVMIQKHSIEESHTALGSFEMHTLDVKPVDGQASTLRIKLPIVEEDGTMVVSGNKYQLRAQRIDRPLRKIGPDKVGLTSYYGKVFVGRSNRKSNSSVERILRKLNSATISEDTLVRDVAPADVFDNNFPAPYIYNALANHFKSFTASDYHLTFDHTERAKMFSPEELKTLEKNGSRLVGRTRKGEPILVNTDDTFTMLSNGQVSPLGDIFDLTGVDRVEAPVDFAEVKVFSKAVPVGPMLAYSIGFKKLIKLLKARYRLVEGRKQKNLGPHEYAVSFSDVSYIFDRRDRTASLILAGFQEFEKQLRMYPVKEFDNKDVYFNLFETKGLTALYMREMELTSQLFVDPITKGILESLGEPVTYHGLVIRAVEMLNTYHFPDSQDARYQRIRGYERFSGAIYKCMVTSIRQFKNKNISGKSRVEMSPYEVWSMIVKDPAVKMVEDINPIQNLKATEIVTYVGEGGRSKDAMNKASRAYHVADMGLISEATVDSSDVGITAYMPANPNFRDQRGLGAHDGKIVPSNLLSTSALLAPCGDQDD